MSSLRMNTQEVIDTGLSFIKVVFLLHILAAILIGIGFLIIDSSTGEVCGYSESVEDVVCKNETAGFGLVFGWIFWISAVVTLISGYIGLASKLLTDSIAVGIYKSKKIEIIETKPKLIENIPPPVILPPKLI
tara:strand:+ start:92 stop:490 length:399 start_codon:yes stop_codon:yes gene_type:complete